MKIAHPLFAMAIAGPLVAMVATAQTLRAEPIAQGELLATKGTVEFSKPNTNWFPAQVGLQLMIQDRLRTLALSRATLRLAELGRLQVDELTTLEILPPSTTTSKATVDLRAGAMYFFTREKPGEFLIQTPYAIGASRGTEFLTEVDATGRTVLTVFDGEVELSNRLGHITLTNDEQGTVEAGQQPKKTAVIGATNIVQWWLYYPGVLDAKELPLTQGERVFLAPSLAAYQAGDLKGALAAYPPGRVPQSEAERIYYAGLLLSVGQVGKAEAKLANVSDNSPFAMSLRRVIAVVTSRRPPDDPPPKLATEWLADSYQEQPISLEAALASARQAVAKDTDFGFGWERVAELEFSFGRIKAAKEALEKALVFSPRNAQALALRGFILAAENHFGAASDSFEQAVRADGALGNGWLGRGLCRIHAGDEVGGLSDLQTAAASEPNRSLLRSYLGKAFGNVWDDRHAGKELALAMRLDTNDPTPWLYSALLNEQENRLTRGVEDLEKSLALNDNRRVYRSELLLDQDRAVRSSSLATIYQRDGMDQVSFREASAAVADDDANYSAHLFLANSLDALQDPMRINLRYETPLFSELLLANLLAPPGAPTLSQNISQQEYSKLFEMNRFGFAADSFYRSDGLFHELASQFGAYRNTSYSLDFDYLRNDGIRPNNELSRADGTATVKQQLSPQDSLFLSLEFETFHAGDIFQHYNPAATVDTNYNRNEHETPIVALGYHREWAPGVHTLVLASSLNAEQHFTDTNVNMYEFLPANSFVNFTHRGTNVFGLGGPIAPTPFGVNHHDEFQIYSAELNQIFQSDHQTIIAGGRFQTGDIHARDDLIPSDSGFNLYYVPTTHSIEEGFQRITGYAYDTLQLPTHLLLTGGFSWDQITYPRNYFDSPVTPGENTRVQAAPKAALVWSPVPQATVRAIYAQSMGGVVFDQSDRLEPTQLAGFNQTFRNVIPASVAYEGSAAQFEVIGFALDLKFKTRTYIGIQAQRLRSDGDQDLGAFAVPLGIPFNPFLPTNIIERLDYKEPSLSATVNQLVGDNWSIGTTYQFTHSELKTSFPSVPTPSITPSGKLSADLHQVTPYIVFNHPSGFFARAEAPWYAQHNYGDYNSPEPGDSFYQVNLYTGYQFPRQHGSLTFGLLNVNGTDYHLNPLNPYLELPRSRVWSLELRLSF
jgi:hypothetical protein